MLAGTVSTLRSNLIPKKTQGNSKPTQTRNSTYPLTDIQAPGCRKIVEENTGITIDITDNAI